MVFPSLPQCKQALPPRTFGLCRQQKSPKNSSERTATVDKARSGCDAREVSQSQPLGKAFLVAKKQLCKDRICRQCTMTSRTLVRLASVKGLHIIYISLDDRGL